MWINHIRTVTKSCTGFLLWNITKQNNTWNIIIIMKPRWYKHNHNHYANKSKNQQNYQNRWVNINKQTKEFIFYNTEIYNKHDSNLVLDNKKNLHSLSLYICFKICRFFKKGHFQYANQDLLFKYSTWGLLNINLSDTVTVWCNLYLLNDWPRGVVNNDIKTGWQCLIIIRPAK